MKTPLHLTLLFSTLNWNKLFRAINNLKNWLLFQTNGQIQSKKKTNWRFFFINYMFQFQLLLEQLWCYCCHFRLFALPCNIDLLVNWERHNPAQIPIIECDGFQYEEEMYDFSKANYSAICDNIISIHWDSILSGHIYSNVSNIYNIRNSLNRFLFLRKR